MASIQEIKEEKEGEFYVMEGMIRNKVTTDSKITLFLQLLSSPVRVSLKIWMDYQRLMISKWIVTIF